ncbi:MAG: hypothetical protein MJ114_02665, partial [Acetatifactor sp.]|nr:hypothetical protein [Acetatifactor sp.]
TCCLYQYSFDLFTAADLEKHPDVDPTSEYWVIFYTEGEGKPLYIKYFNCDYFTREQAIESIAPGMTKNPYTFEIIGNAEEASVHARLSCLDENSNLVWEYLSEEVYVSELDVVQDIGLFAQGYVFIAGGKVDCIETRGKNAGTVKWVNTKFNGASACFLGKTETEDILYLTGYYGPDLMTIDLNTGATKARYEKLDYSEIPDADPDEFIYPVGINRRANGIEVSYDYNRKTAVVDPGTGKVVSIEH